MKYDTWHKEILSKFASRLGDNMQDFYGSVSKVINYLVLESRSRILLQLLDAYFNGLVSLVFFFATQAIMQYQ